MHESTKRSLYIFAVLNFLDYLTTYTAIELRNRSNSQKVKKSVREVNPLIRPLVERGRWKELFALKSALVWFTWYTAKKSSETGTGRAETNKSLLQNNIILGAVVCNNARVIMRVMRIEKGA